jgi:hypothetical protein
MDLRQRLKIETKTLHDQIEQTFLLKEILLEQITLYDYQLLIQTFYESMAPCEVMIDSLLCKPCIENKKKMPWLAQHLHTLKVIIHKQILQNNGCRAQLLNGEMFICK